MFIRRLAALFCALVILFTASCAFAGSGDKRVRVLFDGEEISFRVAPQFYNNRLIVPVRPLLEALGTQVAWDQEKNVLSTVWDGKNVVVHINQSMIEINGNIVEADTPAVIVGGATMMPLRAVSELFGLKVKWDRENNVVEVESSNYIPFQRVKGNDDLPTVVRQWVDVSMPEKVNRTMELENRLYVLSSLGWKPTGGYDVKIIKIVRENTSFRVNVESREPLPGQATIQVISHPYDLVCLDLKVVGRPSTIIFHHVNR
ncbi:MAG: stalk domain-containing protein [Bacillota bacterium]